MSISEITKTINSICRQNNKNYACKVISWNDSKRFQKGGNLSCIGPNITDTYLTAKDGRSLYTLRSDNFNEKLGIVRAEDVKGRLNENSLSIENKIFIQIMNLLEGKRIFS